MTAGKCPCETLERLEGASVQAYISSFLKSTEEAGRAEGSRFKCKVCGREWEKRAPEGQGKRPSLVRLK